MPSMGVTEVRTEIELAMDGGEWRKAARMAQSLWEREAGSATANFVVACFERMRPHLDLAPYRCAILRSFTVEPLVPLLRAAAFTAGIDLTVHVGEFNTYAQEFVDAGSSLYAFDPQTAILAVQTRDLAPELWNGFAGLDRPHGDGVADRVVERVTGQFAGWIRALRSHSQANLVIHSLEAPMSPALGVFDSQSEDGQTAAIYSINRNLRRLAHDNPGVYILDYDGLVARYGREQWADERKWLSVRLPLAAASLIRLTREWMRFLHPLTGKVAKAVAVDLDNTLWGGVIGEDGMAGIQVGSEYPGAAYRELQRALLDLSQRGILLAVCSKNNPEEALAALESHPGMLLRPRHFAAMRINWQDKARSLREIAAELNIGLDALAFLDDNPVEREHVRREAPEAMVLALPDDPMRYAQAVRDAPIFERLALSEEDRQRNQYYAAGRERAALEQAVSSPEEFYRSLEQEAEIQPVNALTLARAAQLTQKTNQFNLTTRRYTEQQIAEIMNCPGWRVLSLKVRDRYADNGLVGLAILRDVGAVCDAGAVCEIDTFLLSCRVIGRTVETALVAQVAAEARTRGATRLEGWFLPTKKNAPARDFYARHGFELAEERDGGQLWRLDLSRAELRCPEWIRMAQF
ncbi:MAG: HAD-IIIC family phosphatase [Bryobacteraceae bacterium]